MVGTVPAHPLRGDASLDAPELNLRILLNLGLYLTEHFGREGLRRVAEAGGLEPGDLDGRNKWVTLERMEAVMLAARSLMDSDETFRGACAWRYGEQGLGLARYIIWAVSPWDGYRQGVKAMPLITSIGEWSLEGNRNRVTLRYVCKKKEGRLICLSRQGQIMALPTVWGLPPAHLVERACISRGDSCCEYEVRVYETRRWLPIVGGMLAGLAASAATLLLHHPPVLMSLLPPAFGALAGVVFELRRTNRINLEVGADIQEEFHRIAAEEAEARKEIFELQVRQQAWAGVLEEQVAERTELLHRVTKELEDFRRSRATALRDISHDLRNPLAIVKANLMFLNSDAPPSDGPEAVRDMLCAVDRMTQMLVALTQSAVSETRAAVGAPEEIATAPLVESLGRRLRALVFSRDIRASLFASREVPATFSANPLVFDRIIDNLFTNAAKYTDRGSIVVELTGKPGFFTVKISDTGRGIAPDSMEKIFSPGQSDVRAADSFGLGLSVVVQLLAQIGGSLDVMSKPNVGTTFWAHFPVAPPSPRAAKVTDMYEDNADDVVARVVRIRRAEGA
jgi:signal transduction histidine kinase